MRQIREVLRLHLQAGLTYAECGRALKMPKSTVGATVLMARGAGVDWAVAEALDDAELERRLYRPPVPRASRQLEPDWAHIHQELKRPAVTLQLLWEEYARGNELAYKYTSFCIKYRAWAAALARSMRQIHPAGERLFIDYAGQTVPIIDESPARSRQPRSSSPRSAHRTTPTRVQRRGRRWSTGSAPSPTPSSSSTACRGCSFRIKPER